MLIDGGAYIRRHVSRKGEGTEMKIQNVMDASFAKYGRVLTGYPTAELLAAMEKTEVPADVIYVPSVKEIEELPEVGELTARFGGGLDWQIGYCNGHNQKLNALEYHRSSELNVAATDLILLIGMEKDIEADATYDTANVEAFLVPKGTVIEVYATTLHYAPCGIDGEGFRCVVGLPRGTNTDLETVPKTEGEDRLLFAKNKWLIGHPEGGLPKQAWIGLKGENLAV